MTIVIVEDNYLHTTNGTTISTIRFRDELIKRGHTVRVVGIGIEGPDMYGVKEHKIPIVSKIAAKNYMRFARFDREIVAKAFEGADLVHLIFPWQGRCLTLAKEMDIPVSAAFHVQPQNITYNIRLNNFGFINRFIFFLFKKWLYEKVDNIHCPSDFTAKELLRNNYEARLHVISNGILGGFVPPEKPVEKDPGVINILMIGRLSREKRQDLVIKAIMHSKYREKIQAHFLGQGPMQKYYSRLGSKLPRFPVITTIFDSQERLIGLIQEMDIYVHASDAEIEGIACLEAISCGRVPIVANSKKSATPQFTLDERSLFKKGKYLDLRDKIDYWIEHPQERERMGKKYAKLGERYNISYSALKLEKMFSETIRDHKTKKMIRDCPKLKNYHRNVERNNHIKEFFCRLFYFLFAIPALRILNWFWFGIRTKNRKVLRKLKNSGAVAICNHVHAMDSPICAVGIPHKKLIFVSKPSNFAMKGAGLFVDALGSVPTPSTPRELHIFINSLSKKLRKRKFVLFFPEGDLKHYDENLRNFQRGAFVLAVDARVPVLPLKILYRKPGGLLKYIRKKPFLTLAFGEPIYHNDVLLKNEAVNELKEKAEKAMQAIC